MKIAMWSGPRNLSTAMMYAFGNRVDCAITDEPFYAAYLHHTGVQHPMGADIMASQPTDPATVVQTLTGPNPGGRAIWYQKHMTHHMIDGFPMDWLEQVTNVFLIRHPARVMASYQRKRENPTLGDLGFVEQKQIYDACVARGQAPVVIDSDDILQNPVRALRRLCDGIGITFDPAMLSWPAGPRDADGIWAAHWYDAVHKSTGFGPPPGDMPDIPADDPTLTAALRIYDEFRGV